MRDLTAIIARHESLTTDYKTEYRELVHELANRGGLTVRKAEALNAALQELDITSDQLRRDVDAVQRATKLAKSIERLPEAQKLSRATREAWREGTIPVGGLARGRQVLQDECKRREQAMRSAASVVDQLKRERQRLAEIRHQNPDLFPETDQSED